MAKSGCRVLIVDDDADTREALAAALADVGFLVEQAHGGRQALEWMEKEGDPDVVLLDLHMPEMDGAQLMEQMPRSRARVIILTADTSARLMRFAREATLLAKPIGLDELEKAVEEACAA